MFQAASQIWLSLSTLMQPQPSFGHHPHPHSCHHISVYCKAIIIIIIIINTRIFVFFMLTVSSHFSQYMWSTFNADCSFSGVSASRARSSANINPGTCLLSSLGPWSCWCNSLIKSAVYNVNRIGLRGQPCLTPLLII